MAAALRLLSRGPASPNRIRLPPPVFTPTRSRPAPIAAEYPSPYSHKDFKGSADARAYPRVKSSYIRTLPIPPGISSSSILRGDEYSALAHLPAGEYLSPGASSISNTNDTLSPHIAHESFVFKGNGITPPSNVFSRMRFAYQGEPRFSCPPMSRAYSAVTNFGPSDASTSTSSNASTTRAFADSPPVAEAALANPGGPPSDAGSASSSSSVEGRESGPESGLNYSYLLAAAIVTSLGAALLFWKPIVSGVNKSAEALESVCELLSERFQVLVETAFPHPDIPLLPDVDDLKYPENLPTLVLDLNKVVVKMEHDRKTGWRVVKRPGADRLFKELCYHYEIVLWSEDNFPVAQEVALKWGLPVAGTLHREQCIRRKGGYIKDLSRLGRRLDRLVIVDHDPAAISLQPDNGILIREFEGDPSDLDLEHLTDFLRMAALAPEPDIRDVIKKHGGGDVDLVRRWAVQKSEHDKKTESRRSLGTRFFGGGASKPINAETPRVFNQVGNSFRM